MTRIFGVSFVEFIDELTWQRNVNLKKKMATRASKNNRHDTISDVNIFLEREFPDRTKTIEVVCSSARRDMDRHAKHTPYKLFCETLALFPEYVGGARAEDATWPESTSIVCWHDCHRFDTVPIPIPKVSRHTNNNQNTVYTIFGVFCSCNCAVAYILERNTYDQQLMLLLFKQMVIDVFHLNTRDVFTFEPAPPRIFLDLFGGHLSITQFQESSLVSRNTLLNPPFISYSMVLEENTRQNSTLDNKMRTESEMLLPITTHAIRGLRKPVAAMHTPTSAIAGTAGSVSCGDPTPTISSATDAVRDMSADGATRIRSSCGAGTTGLAHAGMTTVPTTETVASNTLFDKFVASKVESVEKVSEPKKVKSAQPIPKKNGRKNVKPSVVAVLPMSAASFQSGTGTLAAYLQSTPRK